MTEAKSYQYCVTSSSVARALVEGIQATVARSAQRDDFVRVQNEIEAGGEGNGRREACRISPLTMQQCPSMR